MWSLHGEGGSGKENMNFHLEGCISSTDNRGEFIGCTVQLPDRDEEILGMGVV